MVMMAKIPIFLIFLHLYPAKVAILSHVICGDSPANGGASVFNWWEENCCIFLKKISSPNAFYLFLPLFKHQTTPYYLPKSEKICLSLFFSNRNRKSVGEASQQQQSHLYTIQIHYTLYFTFFYLLYHFIL